MSNDKTLQGLAAVDFGVLDAESEKNLSGYFVDTGVLAKLASGQKHFVIGRKGSGKTALFRLASISTDGHGPTVRAVIPVSRHWNA